MYLTIYRTAYDYLPRSDSRNVARYGFFRLAWVREAGKRDLVEKDTHTHPPLFRETHPPPRFRERPTHENRSTVARARLLFVPARLGSTTTPSVDSSTKQAAGTLVP